MKIEKYTAGIIKPPLTNETPATAACNNATSRWALHAIEPVHRTRFTDAKPSKLQAPTMAAPVGDPSASCKSAMTAPKKANGIGSPTAMRARRRSSSSTMSSGISRSRRLRQGGAGVVLTGGSSCPD